MIVDVGYIIIIGILAILGGLVSAVFSVFSLPIAAIQSSMVTLLSPVYYLKGIMPVTDMLNIMGYLLGFYSSLFAFNVVMWIYGKIPFIGKK